MAQVVRGGKAGGALESSVLELLEPLVAESVMVASSRLGLDWGMVPLACEHYRKIQAHKVIFATSSPPR